MGYIIAANLIPVTYPYMTFDLNVCNYYKDNEQKVNDDRMMEQGNTICPRPFNRRVYKKKKRITFFLQYPKGEGVLYN